jgi:threonine/homoserine/homoserine lactone efflux protein
LIHIAAAAAGISAALASSDIAFGIVRYAGAAYLVYLGIRVLARRDAPSGSVDVSEGAFKQAWRQGVLVQLLNPKVGLFFLAFLPQFLDTKHGDFALQILVLGGLLALIGLAVDCIYALVAGAAGAALRARPGRLRAVSAAVYIALGLAAALTG